MAMMNEMEYRTIGSALAGGYRAAVYCRLSKDDDLQGESASRTTLTIAHRLTTIKNYDRILVLGSEGIVESGTHDQLLAKQGVYYRLWNQLPGDETL